MPERHSIEIGGFAHRNPVPAACRIGNLLFSGVLTGRDPHTKEMPENLETQVRNVFAHVRELMEASGGSTDNIAKLTVWLADYRDREALNAQWVQMFPDPQSRPARQVMHAVLDQGARIQADLVAVFD